MAKKTYYIEFYGTSGNGYVSYDNEPCNSVDYAMLFDNEKEAEEKCEELQREWASLLEVTSYNL